MSPYCQGYAASNPEAVTSEECIRRMTKNQNVLEGRYFREVVRGSTLSGLQPSTRGGHVAGVLICRFPVKGDIFPYEVGPDHGIGHRFDQGPLKLRSLEDPMGPKVDH